MQPRDFYDLYMFYNLYKDIIDYDMLKTAVKRTAEKRGSEGELADWISICDEMMQDSSLESLWENYRINNAFSSETTFVDVMNAVKKVGRRISIA